MADSHSIPRRAVSHFRILEKLCSGGIGAVYKAEDATLECFAVPEILPEEPARDRVR
jgi:hypothetical protein